MAISVLQSSYKLSGLDVAVVAVNHADLLPRHHTQLSCLDRIWVLATLDISSSSLCIGFYQIACSEPIVLVVWMLLARYDPTILVGPCVLSIQMPSCSCIYYT
jgi:hypothetical protein